MAITFGILAALISAVAIWLGYLNGAAKDEQYKKLTQEKDLRARQEKTLSDLNKEIEGYNTKFESSLAMIKDEYDKKDKQEQLRTEKELALVDLQSQVAELEKKKDHYDSIIPDIGEVKRMVENLRSTKKRIAALDEEIDRLKKEGETLTIEIAQQENTITYNKRWMKNHSEFQSQDELDGKIKSIYKSWGFVVVDTGDIGGLTPRSLLLVKRGEETICELVVKNATNSAASAEILFDTMKEGDFIQIGDTVVARPKDVIPEAEQAEAEELEEEEAPKKNKAADPFAAGAADPFGI